MTIDPATVRYILATDCGSTTTKAILIQLVDGVEPGPHAASRLGRIPRALVEHAVASAPARFTVSPRNPARARLPCSVR